MLKHTAKPKSLNEIVIRFSPGDAGNRLGAQHSEGCEVEQRWALPNCLAASCHCASYRRL